MRIVKWLPMMLLIVCTGCSSVVVEDAERVRLEYWEEEGSDEMPQEEYLDEENGLDIFVEAANSAEEMEEGKIITTRPVLTMEFELENQENRTYHLWVTEDGEGYLQSLHPHKNATFQMDVESAEDIKYFIASIEGVEILQGDIEFEQ